jgi:hypothetical protein
MGGVLGTCPLSAGEAIRAWVKHAEKLEKEGTKHNKLGKFGKS